MRVIAATLLVAAPALVSAAVTPVRRGFSGSATWYYTGTGNAGSCGQYLNDGAYTVAMNSFQYTNEMCGKTVTISANGKTTQATVMDLCPVGGGNCNYGDMDLSPGLFAFFADPNVGKFPMEWDFSDGGSPPPPPPTTQDPPPYVEPTTPHVEPTTTPVDTPVVHESVAPTTIPEVAPTPTTTEQPPTTTPYTETTSTPWTESTTDHTTSTESAYAAEATTTPTFGDQLAVAIKDGNVHGLGEALSKLGELLMSSKDTGY